MTTMHVAVQPAAPTRRALDRFTEAKNRLTEARHVTGISEGTIRSLELQLEAAERRLSARPTWFERLIRR